MHVMSVIIMSDNVVKQAQSRVVRNWSGTSDVSALTMSQYLRSEAMYDVAAKPSSSVIPASSSLKRRNCEFDQNQIIHKNEI